MNEHRFPSRAARLGAPARSAGARSLLAGAAAAVLFGLSIAPAQAQCKLKPECSARGNNQCWETDTVPSLRVTAKGEFSSWWKTSPQISFSVDNGTPYVLRLDKVWETNSEGDEVVRSSVPFASLDWTVLVDDDRFAPPNCRLELTTRSDPFRTFIFWLYWNPNDPSQLQSQLIVSGYQWVDDDADLNLSFFLRGDPGDKVELDAATSTVTLSDLTLPFATTAQDRSLPGSATVDVGLDASVQTIHLKYSHFEGTLWHQNEF